MTKTISINVLEKSLLDWYDVHKRIMPWRAVPGHAPNPYHVWLSEIMLQQTTVATVRDYFSRFVTRWPRIEDLAKANLDDVFHAWQGLGYYSRARNLHKCAQVLCEDFKGILPKDENTLLTLPGIGPYTAAAIASIAYDQPTVPVDGNIVRVMARLLSLKTPLPAVKQEIQRIVSGMRPTHRSGDFAQSLMDLGATICRPRNPLCGQCPLQSFCKGHAQRLAGQLPFPAPKVKKPQRYGVAFWIENKKGEILLEKRPLKGLLGGLVGVPTTPWLEEPINLSCDKFMKGVESWEILPIAIHHTFTHFHLELKVVKGHSNTLYQGFWCSLESLKSHALPTVMKKVIQQATKLADPLLPK